MNIDSKRETQEYFLDCGIYVRAQDDSGKWKSVPIAHLDKKSLLEWLRSRGGNNPWAEDVVGIILGHGHLHSYDVDENGNFVRGLRVAHVKPPIPRDPSKT